jgi:predicted dehydrogenase
MPQVQVVAAADPSPEALSKVREMSTELALYADAGEMIDGTSMDAVVVSVPTGFHAACAREVLSRGLALYLEKPLASELSEGRTLVEMQKSTNSRSPAMVGYNFRRDPLIREMKHALSSGLIGRPLCINSVKCAPHSSDSEWRTKRSAGGGVILDLASHHFDLWRFLTGEEIDSVLAHLESVRHDHDVATLEAKISNGVICHGHFSAVGAMAHRIEVYGDRGRLAVDFIASSSLEHTPGHAKHVRLRKLLSTIRGIPYLLKKRRAPWWTPSYQETLREFVQAVSSGQEIQPNIEDGLRALEAVAAAEESARTKTSVHCAPSQVKA